MVLSFVDISNECSGLKRRNVAIQIVCNRCDSSIWFLKNVSSSSVKE